jgi:hypothetical protein
MFEQRVSDESRQQAGHSQASMTAAYIVPNIDRRAEVVRAMQERFVGKEHRA